MQDVLASRCVPRDDAPKKIGTGDSFAADRKLDTYVVKAKIVGSTPTADVFLAKRRVLACGEI